MNEQQQVRFIPKNVLQSGKISTFKKRNLIEGVIWAILFALLINFIPFVFKVKLIIIASVGAVLIIVNGFGIRGNAISSTVFSYLKYRYYLNKFHYRRINNEHQNSEPIINDDGKVRTIVESKTINTAKKLFE